MAYTATLLKSTVHGDERAQHYQVTADAASGSVATGLGYVTAISYAPISCATAAFKLKANLSAASATANGTVMVSSAVNGDVFFMTVFGR